MNMFNLISRFWREAEGEKFAPSEAALYFYLLYRANTQKWQMPIRCPTSTICAFLGTTKQNVMKAREGLSHRGLVKYTSGSGNGNPPLYILTDVSDQLSGGLSPQLSVQLSPYNKEKDKDNFTNNTCAESVLSLNELEKMFMDDLEWQRAVLDLLLTKNITGATIDKVNLWVSQFFHYLRASGQTERQTNDCKNHFVNWLTKQLNKKDISNDKHQSKHNDRLRALEVMATSAEAYHQPF